MTFRENNQRVTNPSGEMVLLEVTNPSFSEPMQIANDTVDWVSQGKTYVGINFGFTLPEDVKDGNPRMQLSMPNVGSDLLDELEGIQPGTVTMAKLIVVDRSTPDVYQHVFWLPITSISATPSAITATASVDDLMRQSACRQIANPFTLPGLF